MSSRIASGTSPWIRSSAVQRVLELALLEVDPREPISGLVAHCFVDRALEHRRDRAAGAVVHPVVELEVADGELRVVQVVVQRVERRLVDAAMLAELGVEPLQRVEEMALAARSTAPRRNTGRAAPLLAASARPDGAPPSDEAASAAGRSTPMQRFTSAHVLYVSARAGGQRLLALHQSPS